MKYSQLCNFFRPRDLLTGQVAADNFDAPAGHGQLLAMNWISTPSLSLVRQGPFTPVPKPSAVLTHCCSSKTASPYIPVGPDNAGSTAVRRRPRYRERTASYTRATSGWNLLSEDGTYVRRRC